MTLDYDSLRQLREVGVSSAKFGPDGALSEVAFFQAGPPDMPPSAAESVPDSPLLVGARAAASTLMRGPTPPAAKERQGG